MVYVWWAADLGRTDKEIVGDSYGLEFLIGAYWMYDDLAERPSEASYADELGSAGMNMLDKDVIRAGETWLAENAPQKAP